jgi:RHS repeat-associated protein
LNLSQEISADRGTITLAYDWRGLRTRKTTTAQAPQGALTTLYHYDPQGHLIGESTVQANSLTPQKTYLWRDDTLTGVVVHQPTRQVAVILTDHLGSPIEVHDMSGALLWTWYSDAFGTTLPGEDPGHTGKRFTLNVRFPGQYYDAESGLHYNGQRYYAPTLGRYISSDPIGLAGGVNTYIYANGVPIVFSDPFGLDPDGQPSFTTGKNQVCVAACAMGGAIVGGAVGSAVGGTVGGIGGAAGGTLAAPGIGTLPGSVAGASAGSTWGGVIGAGFGGTVGNALGQTVCDSEKDQECEKRFKQDAALCEAIAGARYGRRGIALCKKSATERYSECLRSGVGGIRTPLHGVETPL